MCLQDWPLFSLVYMDFNSFSILAWNIWGGAGARGKRRVKELICSFRSSLFAIFETHCSFESVSQFWTRAGYELCGVLEAVGHQGGIWVLAPVDRSFTVQVVEVHAQAVSVSLSHNYRSWTCTAIYASPNPTLREELWSYFSGLRQRILNPWLAVGDFNEITSPSEVVGGDFSQARASRMLEMM